MFPTSTVTDHRRSSYRIGRCLLAALTTSTFVISIFAQSGPRIWKEPDESLKSMVMGKAFPDHVAEKAEASLILRFNPSFSPESQVIAVIRRDGTVLTQFEAANISSREAFRRVSAVPTDPDKVVRLMAVRQTLVQVPADVVRGWFRQFWTVLADTSQELGSRQQSRSVQLDGTVYSCEYRETGIQIKLLIPGSEVGQASSDDRELVKWMNMIRAMVDKHLGAQ